MLDQHERIVLQFSGGKDSLACLYLCRPYWDKITVLWVNPGNPYPETVEQMAAIKKLVPHFFEVIGEQPEWIRVAGHPVDVLPIFNTTLGEQFAGPSKTKLQSTFDCCYHNLWEPMNDAVIAFGATLVVRGNKLADDLKDSIGNGMMVNGVQYYHPLAGWTDDMVKAYLKEQGVELPPQYEYGVNTSFDCMDCTGYALHNAVRWEKMPKTHPDLWPKFSVKLDAVRAALRQAMTSYR